MSPDIFLSIGKPNSRFLVSKYAVGIFLCTTVISSVARSFASSVLTSLFTASTDISDRVSQSFSSIV